MTYCESLVVNPSRTVIALISDFEEGGSLSELLRCVRRLAERPHQADRPGRARYQR